MHLLGAAGEGCGSYLQHIKKHWLLVEPTGSQREQYLHRESNSDLRFRKPSFYPLNYGDFSIVVQR